jgi:hypothetical protein
VSRTTLQRSVRQVPGEPAKRHPQRAFAPSSLSCSPVPLAADPVTTPEGEIFALLACLYFAPQSPPRRGLLKQLKSTDRERAIAGARNAAWDITYLSDFGRRINEAAGGPVRYLLASMDKSVHLLAQALLAYGVNGLQPDAMARGLGRWWPRLETGAITARMGELFALAAASTAAPRKARPSDYVGDANANGEHALRAFRS